MKYEEQYNWIKKHSSNNITIYPLKSLTQKTNLYFCKTCKNESTFSIKTMRKNSNEIKLKCKICNPPKNKKITFEIFQKRVEKFNPDYKVNVSSFTSTTNKVKATHKICGTQWEPFAKDLMDGKSNCPACGGRMKWTQKNLKQFANKHGVKVLSYNENNIKADATFECKKGHIFNKQPKTFKNYAKDGKPCPICSIEEGSKKRRIYDHSAIKNICAKRGYELLTKKSTIESDSFKLESNKIQLRCEKKHDFLTTFNNFHNNNTGCPECKKNSSTHYREKLCRLIFKEMTVYHLKEFSIPKNDPYLKNLLTKANLKLTKNSLSLDGYCSKIGIAFEHHGQQHYQFIKYFHKTNEKFEKQKKFDQIKATWCEMNGIKLITIPFKLNEKKIPDFISKKIGKKIKINKIKDISTLQKKAKFNS